jgi:Flp pilus assembly protein TadD
MFTWTAVYLDVGAPGTLNHKKPVTPSFTSDTKRLTRRRIRLALIPLRLWGTCTALFLGSEVLLGQAPTPELLFQEAVAAQERGDDAVAVKYYQELLQLHPEALPVHVNLGVTLAHERQFKDAIEQYRIVLAHDSNNRFARMNLAVAYRDSGNIAQAMIELEEMRRTDPYDDQVSMMLADAYLQSGRYADAIPMLSRLETNNPDDPDLEDDLGRALIHQGRLEEGAVRLEKAARKNANAEEFVLAGEARFGISQYDLARSDEIAAQQLNANQPGLATLDGMILQQTSNYDGAESILLKAVAEDPNDFNANLYLGGVFYFKRDLARAHSYLLKALQLQPESSQARYELALVKRANGDLIDALKDLKVVVKQAPDWLQPHIELAALYYRLHNPTEGAKERAVVDRMIAAQQQSHETLSR